MRSNKNMKVYIVGAMLVLLALLAIVLAVKAIKDSQISVNEDSQNSIYSASRHFSASSQSQSGSSSSQSTAHTQSEAESKSRENASESEKSPEPTAKPTSDPTHAPSASVQMSSKSDDSVSSQAPVAPSPTPPAVTTINDHVPFEEGDIIAIIFIGGMESVYDYSLAEKYFAGVDLPTVTLDGQEKYLVIPKYPDDINIYSVAYGENGLTTEYYATKQGAFYITGNISEIYQNMKITTVHNGEYYEFAPCISGRDGSVLVPDFVTVL